MKTYFIVAQADTDSDGYLKSTAIFCDNDGNTELYVSAEEARESIARTVAEFADVMSSLSFNDSLVPIDLDAACETGLVQEVIKGIKAETLKMFGLASGTARREHTPSRRSPSSPIPFGGFLFFNFCPCPTVFPMSPEIGDPVEHRVGTVAKWGPECYIWDTFSQRRHQWNTI